MATDEKHSIGQLIDNLKESIRLKWVELHEQLTSPQQRKVLRTEIKDAMSGLGKTLKQFGQAKKKTAVKKKSSPKKKTSAKKNVRTKSAKKK